MSCIRTWEIAIVTLEHQFGRRVRLFQLLILSMLLNMPGKARQEPTDSTVALTHGESDAVETGNPLPITSTTRTNTPQAAASASNSEMKKQRSDHREQHSPQYHYHKSSSHRHSARSTRRRALMLPRMARMG